MHKTTKNMLSQVATSLEHLCAELEDKLNYERQRLEHMQPAIREGEVGQKLAQEITHLYEVYTDVLSASDTLGHLAAGE